MCTLILVRERERLRVAANRDEQLDRPAGPPRLWRTGERAAVAPEDLEAGGTWIGVNDAGLFAGITNRFGVPRKPDAPSRGRWVPELLAFDTAERAIELVRSGAIEENGFHLLVADLEHAYEVRHDGVTVAIERLPLGVTVRTERSHGAAPAPREGRIARFLAARGTDLETLAEVLDLEDPEQSLDGVRVFSPALNYGTRSSAIIEVSPGGLRFQHAERYPATTAYRDVANVLNDFSRKPEPGR